MYSHFAWVFKKGLLVKNVMSTVLFFKTFCISCASKKDTKKESSNDCIHCTCPFFRMGWDLNPRYLRTPVFKTGTLNLSDTHPIVAHILPGFWIESFTIRRECSYFLSCLKRVRRECSSFLAYLFSSLKRVQLFTYLLEKSAVPYFLAWRKYSWLLISLLAWKEF